MWIPRSEHTRMLVEQTRLQQEANTLREQNRALQVTMDWMRVRVSQLEQERAQLLFNYTGVKVPVPEIAPAPSPFNHPLQSMPSFDDIGDSEAAKLGIQHDPDGTVRYIVPATV